MIIGWIKSISLQKLGEKREKKEGGGLREGEGNGGKYGYLIRNVHMKYMKSVVKKILKYNKPKNTVN